MKDLFKNMPSDARVWIYQADRELNPAEQDRFREKSAEFVQQWTAHKKQLNAEMELVYNRFVVVMVDENYSDVSGCGIDKSVNFLKEMESDLGIKLFDRLTVAYRDANEQIRTVPASIVPELISSGQMTEITIIFNNTVQTKAEWETKWEMPLRYSWLSKYIRYSV
jgi:hypothetical protein